MDDPVKKKEQISIALACLAIAVVIAVIYGGTLKAPWYFDDIPNIVENRFVRDVNLPLWSILRAPRGLTLWTFALNYRFGGLELPGYHLVNISIHLLTSLLVFFILLRLLAGRRLPALAGALLFAAHPLQTQAITYIVQRMTCLSGLFFFLAIALFLQARTVRARGALFFSPRHLLCYGGALLAGSLAVGIKQNAATLPLVMALLLWLHPADETEVAETWRTRFLYLLPFFLAPLALALQQLLLPIFAGKQLADLGGIQTLSALRRPTPLQYLFTEFSVLWLYLRLFVLPLGQAFEYNYPMVEQLWTLRNLLALSGLLGLVGIAWRLRRQRPLITLGIFWFFLTLAVESSIIPLDAVFEHRMYVPLFGLVLILLDLFMRLPQPRWQWGVLCALLLPLGLLAWQRNQLWNDAIAFCEDNLRRVPSSERVNVSLAYRYIDAGRTVEAEQLLKRALEINPDFEIAYVNLSKIYGDRGDYAKAKELLTSAANRFPQSVAFLVNLGTVLDMMNEPAQAESVLRHALAIDPYANVYLNLGVLCARQGRWEEAIAFYRQSQRLFPENPLVYYNAGVAFYELKRYAEARDQYRRAYQRNPGDADVLYNLAVVSLDLGDRQTAEALLAALRTLNIAKAIALEMEMKRPAQERH